MAELCRVPIEIDGQVRHLVVYEDHDDYDIYEDESGEYLVSLTYHGTLYRYDCVPLGMGWNVNQWGQIKKHDYPGYLCNLGDITFTQDFDIELKGNKCTATIVRFRQDLISFRVNGVCIFLLGTEGIERNRYYNLKSFIETNKIGKIKWEK